MNNKLNVKRSAKDRRIQNNQRGALLIGLIITMVIISALSGAMVYIFSSSTLNPVSGKYAQQAYYNAEAGFRYILALYREAGGAEAGRAAIMNFFPTSTTIQTINLPGGGNAEVTISSLPPTFTPAKATASLSGSNLVLSGITNGPFPSAPGYFSIGSGTNAYRYMGISTLSGTTTLSEISPSLPSGYTSDSIQTREHTTIISKGTFGGGSGLWNVNRKIDYSWVLSTFPEPPGPGPAPPPIDLSTLTGKLLTGSMDFQLAYPGGDEALVVAKDQGGVEAEAYVFVPPVTPNPFWTSWVASGGYSSYDLQVKIATGTLSGTTLTNPPTTYANGLTIRAINQGGQKQDFLGVSLVRNGMLLPPDTTVTPPAVYTVWAKSTPYTVGVYVYENTSKAYYRCKTAHTSSSIRFSKDLTKWDPLSNANTPMIVLWRRDSNHANGDGSWLAHKVLDEKSFIVDAAGHTIDWSTLLVRIIEAASIKLDVASAPLINIGDTIAGATGTALVIKKINDIDGNIVLLLNKINGTFTRPATIAGYNTDATWGYRSRDNYIWVFYTDKDDHSSNLTPMETTGVNNIRLGQGRNIANCCPLNWPIDDLQAWTLADDRFSLVDWNSNLNTALFTAEYPTNTIRIMGYGNEAGAIIRTDITSTGGFTRPGPYTVSTDFPGEIGLVSLGGENDAFFDDLAYRLTGGSNIGGVSYFPPIQH